MKKIKHFFQVIWIRFKTESPGFFRRLFKFFAALFAFTEFAYPLLKDFVVELTAYEIVVPPWVNVAVRFVGAMSLGAALVAKMAVEWDKLSEREQKILDRKPTENSV